MKEIQFDLRLDKVSTALVFALTLLLGCGTSRVAHNQETISTDEARQRLAEMRIEYSQDEFIERCQLGDLEAINLFLTAGMSPDTRSRDGVTALMWAAWAGHLEVTQLLLEAGADVNAQTSGGDAVLMFASARDHSEVTQLLLEAGAEVNAKNNEGDTVLLFASFLGLTEIAKLLLEAGAEVNAENNAGETALISASGGIPGNTTMGSHAEVVRLLLDAGADVNARTHAGETALMWASKEGRAEVIQLLKGAGAKKK
ncbi:MAG: ankyrin repeat domain-containing protein [Rhodothermales bacterium]